MFLNFNYRKNRPNSSRATRQPFACHRLKSAGYTNMPWARLKQTVTAFPSYVQRVFRWESRGWWGGTEVTQLSLSVADVCSELSDSWRKFQPIPEVARSKAWVCDRLFAGIVSSNAVASIDVCLA